MMKFKALATALAPLLALLGTSPAHADDFVVLKAGSYRTVVVADMTTLTRDDGELNVDVFVFPDSGSGSMLQAAAVVGCGRNIMNSQHTVYYDVTVSAGRVTGLRKVREEISDFDGNTGTMYGLDNSVYEALQPLCQGTPSGARWEQGDETSIVMRLAPEFIK